MGSIRYMYSLWFDPDIDSVLNDEPIKCYKAIRLNYGAPGGDGGPPGGRGGTPGEPLSAAPFAPGNSFILPVFSCLSLADLCHMV